MSNSNESIPATQTQKAKPILSIGVKADGKLMVETSEANMKNKKMLFTVIGEAIKIIANTPEPGVIVKLGDNDGGRARLRNFLRRK